MDMVETRLGPQAWLDAGLKALAKSGAAALKADTLAGRLGVSRGSFYWHFADIAAFHAAVLHRWRETALEQIIAEIEDVSTDRLETLLARAFAGEAALERAVRAWATSDEAARRAVAAVDEERIRYLRRLLVETGIPLAAASVRARLLNWAYLGFAISSPRLDPDSLKRVIRDLSALARLQ
jgi:AcrR family transcriptional regulator